MKSKLKYTLAGLVTLLVLFAVVIFSVPQTIDTNLLKSQITHAVYNATGRQLTIDGEVSWTFLPGFTLEADHVALANPDNFPEKTAFADIDKLELSVELLPLIFSKKLIMNELILENATINMTTLPNGQTNWENLFAASIKAQAEVQADAQQESATAETAATASDNKTSAIDFDIAKFKVINGDLVYNNQQRSQRWEMSKLNIDSGNIALDRSFPLEIEGKITHPPSDQVIDVQINTDININPEQKTYILKSLQVTGNVTDTNNTSGQKINISLDEVKIDSANKAFIFDKLVLDAFGSHGTGNLQATNSGQYPQVSGALKLDQLSLGKYQVSDVNLPINGKNGIYTLQPITAKLYGGTISTNIIADTTKAIPEWQVSYQLSAVQMQTLMQSVYGYDRLSGSSQGSGQFTAAGLDTNSIISSLTGTTNVQLNNGSLDGVDIDYWWQVGNKLLNKDPVVTGLKDTKQTQITNMSGSFTFNQGVGTTNNLQMYNNIVFIEANGTIDLVKQTVKLTLNVSQCSNGQATGTPIPLIMSGSFNDIKVRPDDKTIAVMAGKVLAGKTGQAVVSKITNAAPALKKPINDVINKLRGK
jgi:AsmA protein